jgi:excisionase family DNA binding protein
MAPRSPKAESRHSTEVAGILNVAKQTICGLAAAERIPAVKVIGSLRFSCADIDIWMSIREALVR